MLRRSISHLFPRSLPLLALVLGVGAPRGLHLRRPPTDPPPVPREFRAAWVTPILDRGLRDWPSSPNLTTEEQQMELRATLARAADAGLNAIILHVRLAGDAFYPTTYAPWSAFLTGQSGVGPSPAYDPLAFAIEEAHARGLQVHAWFNPFRAMLPNFAGQAAASHVTKKHPEWIRKYGSQTWIDPGDPAARKYVLDTFLDVVKRYDVDGIHIDDYFYPYQEVEMYTRRVKRRRIRERRVIPFPDNKTWAKYGKARGFTDRDAWRRANIDDFVQQLYKSVKAIRPSVVVGISPFGIWRPGSPPGITGLDSYSEIYADSKRWLAEGWLDYLTPQLYWRVGGEQDRFRQLDAWWRSVNPQQRYVWPGLYTSHVYAGNDAWPMGEIAREVTTLREARIGSADAPGEVHFRLAALFANNDTLAQTLAPLYRERALVPAFPWLGADVPAQPIVTVTTDSAAIAAGVTSHPASFTVIPGDESPVRWWLIQTRGRDGVWTTSLRPVGAGKELAAAFGTNDPDEVAVSAISPTGIASSPTIVMP
ncbi:MAG TPA: family 10 glycosylhydrolase [Gemmatimonadaceae bacterium]